MGACCSGAIISAVVTLIKPDNEFDWSATKRINLRARAMDRKQAASRDSASGSETPVEKEKQEGVTVDASSTNDDISIDIPAEEYAELQKSLKIATWAALGMTFVVVFVSANPYVDTRRSVVNPVAAYTDTNVPVTLCVLSELFQRLDYCLCLVALRGCMHYIDLTTLGESSGDKEHCLGCDSGCVWRRAEETK
jgi:hypothetical protein